MMFTSSNSFKKVVAVVAVAVLAFVLPYLVIDVQVADAAAQAPIVINDGQNHGSIYGGGNFENNSSGITIRSGSLDTVSNVDFLNNVYEAPHTPGAYHTSYGVGVYVENGLINKINNVNFKNNIVKSWNNNAGGPAITTLSGGNINEVRDSYFEGNQAIAQGNEGDVYPDDPTFTGFNAQGGAIITYSGKHNLDPAATASSVDSATDTSFKNNSAINNGYIPWSAVPPTVKVIRTYALGGAVMANQYAFNVNANRKDVVFEGNQAINNGGATDQVTGAYGGAIYTKNNTLTLNAEGSNISFKDNIATDNTGNNEAGNAIYAANANVVLNSNSGKKIYFDQNQDITADADSTVYVQGAGMTELSPTARVRGHGKLNVTNDGTLYTTTAGINDIETIENNGTLRLYDTGALTRAIDGDGKLKIEGDIENQTDITQERLIIDSGASLNDNGFFIIADKITNNGLFTLNGNYYKADIDGDGTLNITKDTHLVGSINLDDTNIIAGKQLLLDGSIISSKYVAQGKQNKIGGENIAVYGTNNSIAGAYSTAMGQYNNVTGSYSIATGYQNTISGNNIFVLGNNVTSTQNNSVILGNNSTDKAATTITSDTINGKTYNYATTNATGVVSVGAAGNERQIINVANGEVSATSTDAVNGSQLYQTQQAINDLGGIVGVNSTGTGSAITAGTYVTEGQNISSAINSIDSAVAGMSADLGTAENGTYISALETVNKNIKRLDDGIGARVTDGNYVLSANTVNTNIQTLDTALGRARDGNYTSASNSANENIAAIDTKIGAAQDGAYIKKDRTVNENLKELDTGLNTEKSERISGDTGLNRRIDELSSQTSGNIDALTQKVEQGLAEARRDTSKTGANAAALAGLRPLDWNPEDKWNVSVGAGQYRGETAYAVGAFYRPSENSMVNLASSFGTGEVMVSGGLSFRLGKGKNIGQRKVLAQSQDERLTQKFAGQTAELRRTAFELNTANEKLTRKGDMLNKADEVITNELIALKKHNQNLETKFLTVLDELKALRSAQTKQAKKKETAVRTQLTKTRAKAEAQKAKKAKAEAEQQELIKAEKAKELEQAKAILAQKEAAERAEFMRQEAEIKAKREETEQARRIRIAQEQELIRRQYDEHKERVEAERIAREKAKESIKLSKTRDLDVMCNDGIIEEARRVKLAQQQQATSRNKEMPVERIPLHRHRKPRRSDDVNAVLPATSKKLRNLTATRAKIIELMDKIEAGEVVVEGEAREMLYEKVNHIDRKISKLQYITDGRDI